MRGFLHFWFVGGHEGGYWTFVDQGEVPNSLCQDTSHGYNYDKIHTLKDGDKLTVFDKNNPTKIVWKGTVSLAQNPAPRTEGPFIFRVLARILAEQKGVDRETWSKWFLETYPAELFPAAEKQIALRS